MSDQLATYSALEMTIKDARKARAAVKQLAFGRGRTTFSSSIPELEASAYLDATLKQTADDLIADAIKKAEADLADADRRIMALAEQLREQDPHLTP